MKHVLLMMFLLPVLAKGQSIAVIDRNLIQPIYYITTMNMKVLEQGKFVLMQNEINGVIATMREFRRLIENELDIPERMKSVITGSTYFTAGGEKGNYSLVIDSKIKRLGTYYVLVNKKHSKKESLAAIDDFIKY